MEYPMKLAKRLSNIEPFHVMDLLAKAKSMEKSGVNVIHLEVGEPDFATPKAAIEAGIDALQQGHTGYTPATGLPELKAKLVEFYASRYGQTIDAEQIIITPGASGALQLITSLIMNVGETLLLTDPGYPCNRHFLANINADGILVPTEAKDGFHLTPELVKQHWQAETVGTLVASPANPTGAVMSVSQIKDLYKAVCEQNGIFIMDEIYHGLAYMDVGSRATQDAKAEKHYGCHTSVGLDKNLTEQGKSGNVFVVNSFSKYFAMTGWRLGWLVAPKWAISGLEKLAQNLFLAPSTPAQYAALGLFNDECINELEARREAFAERLNYLLPALQGLGFHVPAQPQGAFYIYADISALNHQYSHDSLGFCQALLESTGVAITPGIDFGHKEGHHFVRFAYTVDVPVLKEAVARIKVFLEN